MKRLILACLLLAGCTQPEPYWVKVRPAVQVRAVVEVDKPCGRALALGCFNLRTHEIELMRGMDANLRWCVLNHERKTAAGYGHRRQAGFAIDCGNGEMM